MNRETLLRPEEPSPDRTLQASLTTTVARTGMRMDESTFRKLKTISFFSIFLVLFNHATMLSPNKHGALAIFYDRFSLELSDRITALVQVFANLGVGRVNRPLFFLVSGCLFFWTLEPRLAAFGNKFRRRFVSLVLPYAIFAAWSFLLAVTFSHLPYFQTLISTHGIRECTPPAILHNVFVEPLLYQLWFVRDLIVWVAFSPLIYLVVSRLGWLSAALALGYWVSPLPLPFLEKTGLCFFCIGAWIGCRKPDLQALRLPHASLWLALWLALCAGFACIFVYGAPGADWVQKAAMLVGIAAVWSNYDRLPPRLMEGVQSLVPFTFFIYLTHEPVLTFLKKVLFKMVPLTPVTSTVAFLFLPLLLLALCVLAGRWLKRHHLRLFDILNGGRS